MIASWTGRICCLLLSLFIGTIQPIQYGNLEGLKNCTAAQTKAGIERAQRDIESVCGVQFANGPGGLVIEIGPTQPHLGYIAAACTLPGGRRIILGSDDPRAFNEQRVFQVARHEIAGHGYAFNLEHSSNPASPLHINGPAGPWPQEDVARLQAKFGAPVQPLPAAKLTRLEAAKKILDTEEGRRSRINRWYLAYLFRGCDEPSFKWWLGVWQRDGALAVEAGILASDEAWNRAGRTKPGWLGHLWRTGFGYEPAWTSVEYWAGQMQ